jgi:uncharacterized membrane protein
MRVSARILNERPIMETIEKSIEVDAPVSAVYNQWTQFEEFPQFMEGVEQVQQLDDKRLHWRAEICGKTKEWDAEIVEQIPDQRITWRAISGTPNSGTVRFDKLGENKTQVTLVLNYQPESAMEKVADTFGAVSLRVHGDLKRFQEFIEKRGAETGGWRGEIHGSRVETSSGARLKSATEIASEPRSKRVRKET